MNSPQSVTRVINILEALCASPTPVSLADLSRALGTPKSSLAALLRGLAVADLVAASDGTYRLGRGAFGLGSALLEARRRLQSSDLVREGMRRLVDRSGETVLFAVRDAGAPTCPWETVDRYTAPRADGCCLRRNRSWTCAATSSASSRSASPFILKPTSAASRTRSRTRARLAWRKRWIKRRMV
jgi:DNA-binding IclR family transcriptional regulator